MRVADIEFVNARNANKTGVGSKLVADDTLVFFNLRGIKDNELEEIINYKSFIHTSWKEGKRKISFVYKYGFGPDSKVIFCYSGFSTILIRLLQNKYGYTINGKELYKAKEIVKLPTMLYSLWDFQRDAIEAWIKFGCYGILQCPTSSGKSIIACSIIKKMNVRTIILCHTSDLLINVWFNYLTQQFGEEIKDRIGIIGGGLSKKERKMMRICEDDFSVNIKKDIVIATSQSLLHGDKLTILGEEKFGLMVVDECLPYNTIINTSKGKFEIGELYDVYNIENKKYLIERMKIDSLDLVRSEIIKCNFIPKKTIIKKMYELKTETGLKFTLSDDHKCLNRNKEGIINYNESKSIKNVAYSLLRNYNMNDLCIKARIFGYMLGDGNINPKSYSAQIYGDYNDMMRVIEEIKNIGYDIAYIRDMKDAESKITTEDGEILNVCGDVCTIGINPSFGHHFNKLGYPTGKKTDQTYKIPEWIMNGSLDVKREFLAGYMGAEGTKIRERLKRCFEVLKISYYKREDLVEKSIPYAKQLIILFKEFNVTISNIVIKKGNIRKDGTISKDIIITFSNENNSMLNLLEIGFRYCKEREISGEMAKQYMLYSKISNDKVKKTCDYAIELRKKGYGNQKIFESIQNFNDKGNISLEYYFNNKKIDSNEIKENEYCNVNKSKLDHWFSSKRSVNEVVHETKSKSEIMEYEEWTKKVYGDVIFLDIINKKFIKEEQGYDLEILNDNHNYFIDNGINVHNCHHYSAEQFKKVSGAIRAAYRLGLSATLLRSDGLSPIFYALLGDVRYRIGIKELAKKGLLVEPIFYSIIIEDDESCHKIRNCKYKLLEYSRYVKKVSGSSELKFRYILGLCQSLQAKGRKFMLYTDFVNKSGIDEDGEFTVDNDVYTRDEYVKGLLQLKMKVIGISSEMSGVERQSIFMKLGNNELDGIVFGSLGSEGINIPSVEAIILANATASTIRFPQRVGRAMRLYKNKKNCFVYEILLNVEKELQWSEKNFLEYGEQGFSKEIIHVNNDGYLIKKDIPEQPKLNIVNKEALQQLKQEKI